MFTWFSDMHRLCWTISHCCLFVLRSSFVRYHTTKRMFFIRTYPRGHKSFTPSILELITSLAKLVTIVRCMYIDCYWLLFPQCSSYIYVCLPVYMSVLYATVITCVCQCDSIKKLYDDADNASDSHAVYHFITYIVLALIYTVHSMPPWNIVKTVGITYVPAACGRPQWQGRLLVGNLLCSQFDWTFCWYDLVMLSK